MNLVTIQTVGGQIARSILGYGTAEEALSALYSTMASSIADENVSKVVCLLMEDDGHVSKCERFDKTLTKA